MERKEIIKEVVFMHDAIDKVITELVASRLEKNKESENVALSKMESLMIGMQQDLGCIHDYFMEECSIKDKVDVWLRCHLPRVIDKVYSGDEEYENVLNEDMRQMMWEDLNYEGKKEL